MAEEYTELFVVDYTGTVSDLETSITQLTGVEGASTSERSHRDVDTELDFEIRYNTHQTDRTRLANAIENINGVSEVTFG